MGKNTPLTLEQAWAHFETYLNRHVRTPSRAADAFRVILKAAMGAADKSQEIAELQDKIQCLEEHVRVLQEQARFIPPAGPAATSPESTLPDTGLPPATQLIDENEVAHLSSYNVSDNVITALIDAGISTIGDLRAKLATAGDLAKDVKGVGEATETLLTKLLSEPTGEADPE